MNIKQKEPDTSKNNIISLAMNFIHEFHLSSSGKWRPSIRPKHGTLFRDQSFIENEEKSKLKKQQEKNDVVRTVAFTLPNQRISESICI